MSLAIDVRNVSKLFAENVGVKDFDLQVEEGTILGLVGPSGSGKTTAVRLLTGLLRPGVGELTVLGERPRAFSAATRAAIGYLPQTSVMYPNLSIAENLNFAAAIYGIPASERSERRRRVLEWLGLDDAADRRLEDASGGMKRRVGLAVAMMHDPRLMFLDEPTAGLDPILRQSLWERFSQLRDEGKTLVITTQYVGEAAFCDDIVMLTEGVVVARGAPNELRRAAFGGDLVEVVFSEPFAAVALDAIAHDVGATGARRVDAVTVRFTVEDASRTLAGMTEAAATAGLDVTEAAAVVPTFDEVFVRLVDAQSERS
ncbi:MAG: ATP-binding cassette domain-containing protein [Acidimicrobiia bacterium]